MRWLAAMASPKRVNAPAPTGAPTSFERDDVATDYSDLERDAVDQVAMMTESVLTERRSAVLAACPDEFADIGELLRLVVDELGDPTLRLELLVRVRGLLRRPLHQLALEEGGGQRAQRVEDLLAREQARLITYQQRLRVDQSGVLDGQVVDAADPQAASARLSASLAALQRVAGLGAGPTIHDQLWNGKSTTSATGVGTLGTAIDVFEAKTAFIFDQLLERADAAKRHAAALVLDEASGKLNGTIGGLAAAVGIVEGAIDLFSSETSTVTKLDGARGVVTNGMQLVGSLGELGGASWGAGLATTGTMLTLSYQYLKLMYETVAMGWEARLGLVRATLNSKLDQVRDRAGAIADVIDRMERAHALAEAETDPAKRAALTAYQRELAAEAGALIDRFLDALAGPARPHLRYAWSLDEPALQRLFAPLAARRGLRGRDDVLTSTRMLLEGLFYAVTHGRELAEEMTTGEVPE